MTAVDKYFFKPLYYPNNAWSVIGWWESRRPLFNLVVGISGLFTLATALLFAPGGPPPLALVFAYGVLANIGYSLGPLTDLVLRKLLGSRGSAVGPVLFRYGFFFSLGVTLLPIPLILLGRLLQLLF